MHTMSDEIAELKGKLRRSRQLSSASQDNLIQQMENNPVKLRVQQLEIEKARLEQSQIDHEHVVSGLREQIANLERNFTE